MALKGQLHDFNLAEILQLIASQQKSGFLVLEGHREMVFVFDKGVLISTRDRRSDAPDPLEQYLRNYGFFSEAQWSHVAYIRENSSLDLTEILVSEELLTKDQLDVVLQGVAREMAHRGMKMRRGRYNFTATKDSPPGVRWRIAMDVQGVLMEAARRVDEEAELMRILPSSHMTFAQGETPPPPDALSSTGRRIIKLALGGRPLGQILRLARADSFTTREMLKSFLEEGWLEAVIPEAEGDGRHDGAARQRRRRKSSLKYPLVSMLLVVLMLGFGAFRWAPLLFGEMALIGLAEPAPPAVAAADLTDSEDAEVSWLDDEQLSCRQLRLRQIQAELNEAARHYHATHGSYPGELGALIHEGMLAPATGQTIERLGWQYAQLDAGQSYRLEM
jgi:hypothetical protein